MGKPINFQNLPTQSPHALPEKGVYIYEIEDAKMRQSANNEYLEIRAKLCKGDGKKVATIFDRIMDIDSDIPRYKLRQFITALNLPITGDFRLSDLTKMVIGKRILADITQEKSRDPKYPDKAIVDPFSGEIYYPMSKADELLGLLTPNADGEVIDASDATDVDY